MIIHKRTRCGFQKQERYLCNQACGVTKEKLTDHLQYIKFSGMAWYKDGFFYSRYDEPEEDTKLKARNEYHKLYY